MIVWTYTTKTIDALVRKSVLLIFHGNDSSRGRPKIRWIKIIKKDITIYNLNVDLDLNRIE